MTLFSQIITVLLWVGAIVLIALIACALADSACEKLKEIFSEVKKQIEINARKELGKEICGGSYWYSEDKDAESLVHQMGLYIMQHGRCNENKIRENWRENKDDGSPIDLPY